MGVRCSQVLAVSTSSQDRHRQKSLIYSVTASEEKARWPRNHGKIQRIARAVARLLERMPYAMVA